MPKFSQAFPSKFLKPADLNGEDVIVTIQDIEVSDGTDMHGKPKKNVDCHLKERFDGQEKILRLSKMNGELLREKYGDEMDDWIGARVKLFEDKIKIGKEIKSIIKLRVSSAKADVAKPRPRDEEEERPAKRYSDKPLDEEIPF